MNSWKEQKALSGYLWQERDFVQEVQKSIQNQFKISEAVSGILASKSENLEEIDLILNATLKRNMKDPLILKDMQKAVDAVTQALQQNKKIAIFADYDGRFML